jgi:hypothetical protein
MSQLLLGAIALALLLWLVRGYTQTSPTLLARGARMACGYVCMLAGALLLLRGRLDVALPLLLFGAGLAGWLPGVPRIFSGRSHPLPGARSQVRSRFLAMELDHDSGSLRGEVLAGVFAGRELDQLTLGDLAQLYQETAVDPDGRSLLEAYLDRRTPGWREHFQEHAAAGSAGRDGRRRQAMTKEEAYQVLGVEAGADAEKIRRAHRTLMKKLHPDQGGSTYLAARVNEARDVLLGGHH